MTTIKNQLFSLNLPKNSSLVLTGLLEAKETKANDLIKKLGIHRHLVYEALNDLERRGLVKRIIRDKVFWFRLVSGEPLVNAAAKQYEAATELAQLIRLQKKHPESSVTFFSGIEGINDFTEFVLKQKKDLLVLGANTKFRLFFPEIFDLWNKKRQQKNMRFKILVPKEIPTKYLTDVPGLEYRCYDGRLFPSVIWIFSDYLAHIIWQTKQDSEVIMLHQPTLAEQHRDLFETIWRQAK